MCLLKKQRETIDSIERNVESTQENIDSGSHSLRKALTYKSLGTAAGGAVIGTLVGGPVGFIAGWHQFTLSPFLSYIIFFIFRC